MYEIIQDLCKNNGTNISALCELVTGSKGNLATWKKDYMRSDYLLKIAEHFGVTTDYLLGINKTADGMITIPKTSLVALIANMPLDKQKALEVLVRDVLGSQG